LYSNAIEFLWLSSFSVSRYVVGSSVPAARGTRAPFVGVYGRVLIGVGCSLRFHRIEVSCDRTEVLCAASRLVVVRPVENDPVRCVYSKPEASPQADFVLYSCWLRHVEGPRPGSGWCTGSAQHCREHRCIKLAMSSGIKHCCAFGRHCVITNPRVGDRSRGDWTEIQESECWGKCLVMQCGEATCFQRRSGRVDDEGNDLLLNSERGAGGAVVSKEEVAACR
jgi:hypothetical protein